MNSKTKENLYTAINGRKYPYGGPYVSPKVSKLIDFLTTTYGFYDVTFITTRFYNTFLLAMDQQNRMLFIKSGNHAELYRNEYLMGRVLWEIDHEHFLEPLYYSDMGEHFFFANEIMNGDSLQRYADSGKLRALSAADRMSLIRDLYKIFLDLRDSDVVHRDIRPKNLAIIGKRLVLIDFQLAVSKSHYVELDSMNAIKLRNLGSRGYRYKMWQWDDSYSLMKCMRFIGCPGRKYRTEYNKIYNEIKSYIGRDVIKSSKREGPLHRLLRHLIKKRKK